MILSNIVVDLSGEPRFADVDAIHNRTSYASEVTTQRADFKTNLITRDGSCVFLANPTAFALHAISSPIQRETM